MFDDWNFKQAPTGLFRWVLHVPAHLYRYHLGFLLGERQVLITHECRMSGRRYQTPVEVVEHDTVTDEYIVCAGLGRSSDWYRNLVARPALRVQVGNRSWEPRQRLLDVTEAADRFARYEHRHPRTAKRLLAWMERSYDGSDAGRLAMMDEMPMVAFGRR